MVHETVCILQIDNTFARAAARLRDLDAWTRSGLGGTAVSCTVVRVHLGEALPVPDAHAGIVITGSHAMVTDVADWSLACEAWLRRAIAAQVPMLGI